nr:single-strand DNA-binding protein [Candidatus Cloacimonadota bacterium]
MADLRLPRLNKFIGSGRITNDLELRFTTNGTPVLRFTLAIDRSYKDSSDQWQTVTSWIDCVAWNKTAETLANNAHKGSALIVEGRLDTRNWTDQNNSNHKSTEVTVDTVHFLEWKPREDGSNQASPEASMPPEETTHSRTTTDDDVPF